MKKNVDLPSVCQSVWSQKCKNPDLGFGFHYLLLEAMVSFVLKAIIVLHATLFLVSNMTEWPTVWNEPKDTCSQKSDDTTPFLFLWQISYLGFLIHSGNISIIFQTAVLFCTLSISVEIVWIFVRIFEPFPLRWEKKCKRIFIFGTVVDLSMPCI